MLKHSHQPEAIAKRIANVKQSFLRDWIYGGIDGTVTTFAIISGVQGADFSASVLLILGTANLFADGFSMAVSNYLSTQSEIDEYQHYKAFESRQIDEMPDGEREEIRQIFLAKGIKGALLEKIVTVITSDKTLWINTMLHEEYGLARTIRQPIKAALFTFSAFLLCGLVPLVPFFFNVTNSFLFSSLLACFVFFLIGQIKSRWSVHSWWRSGFQTLTVGVLAAGIAYVMGFGLKQFI